MLLHTISKPNVIIIITDQQRFNAVGYIDNRIITPNLNRLSAESVVCTQAYVQSPQCQPSRASILTGRYPTAHRVWWNETKLSPTETTIGNYFKNAGYNTGYYGKLHVDTDYNHHKTAISIGFQHSFLTEDWQKSINTYPDDKKQLSDLIKREFYGPMSKGNWTGEISNRSMHHEDVITQEAIKFIRSQTSPYLAVISYHGPHPPYAAPAQFSNLYKEHDFTVPQESIPNLKGHILSREEWIALKTQYYGSISWIDDNIGKILDADKTAIVVFLSDHGDILGDHGHFSKGIYAYDGNIRIPLMMRLPGINPCKYNHFVQAIDVLPTILQATQISLHHGIQGKSLLHSFVSNTPANEYVISMLCHSYGQRLRMIKNNTFKYWIYGNQEYLYHYSDIEERNNVIGNTHMLNIARFELLKALINCEDPLPFPNY